MLQDFLVPKLYTRGTQNHESGLILATFAYTERSTVTGELQLIVEHLDTAGLSVCMCIKHEEHLSNLRCEPTLTLFIWC